MEQIYIQDRMTRSGLASLNPLKGEVIFKNFDGYWKTNDLTTPSLKNINLKVSQGQFLGVTGKIGSGKSGLLGVVLEEIPYYSGIFAKNGSISYVEQEPFLFSDTLKQNILFGRDF